MSGCGCNAHLRAVWRCPTHMRKPTRARLKFDSRKSVLGNAASVRIGSFARRADTALDHMWRVHK